MKKGEIWLIEICYQDKDILVCVKPARILSTDEPGGLPEKLREQFQDSTMDIRTVHRLDRVVSGLMVLARNAESASELSRQIREGIFQKIYLAVLHGVPPKREDTLHDLLGRDKARKMTFVAEKPDKGIQEASLTYRLLSASENMSLVSIQLHTGRTHQIRVQFSSRGFPLVGERKYSTLEDPCEIALFSQQIGFFHPVTKQWMLFTHETPDCNPWSCFPMQKEWNEVQFEMPDPAEQCASAGL